ncbi:MAG: hypothetical protein Q9207_006450 [Kuettlingeria erythrocarpa]
MQLFANGTTTTADPFSLHDLGIILDRTHALRAHLASSPDAGARLSDENIMAYMETCKPRVVLVRCYWTVGLPVGCAQYMEEKVDMLAEALSEAELDKHEKRVEYLMAWVKEGEVAGRGEGEEAQDEEEMDKGREMVQGRNGA